MADQANQRKGKEGVAMQSHETGQGNKGRGEHACSLVLFVMLPHDRQSTRTWPRNDAVQAPGLRLWQWRRKKLFELFSLAIRNKHATINLLLADVGLDFLVILLWQGPTCQPQHGRLVPV